MTGYVYFFESGGLVKIGKANNVHSRFKQLKTACPNGLKKLGNIKTNKPFELEKKLHDRYAKQRVTGEWFKIDRFIVKAIIETETGVKCKSCGNPPYHYYGVSSFWFRNYANIRELSKCENHLTFYFEQPRYENGMEIIEDMPDVLEAIKLIE